MKSILILLFVIAPAFSYSQTIVLSSQFGKKAPIELKKGDRIYVVIKDTMHLETDQIKIKNRRYRGLIAEIDTEKLTINKYGLKKYEGLNIDQITKVKKIPLREIWGFLPIAAAVIVVHMNATDQLYLDPLLFSLAGASIIYRLTVELIINPLKRTSPELWNKRNRWSLEVVDQ